MTDPLDPLAGDSIPTAQPFVDGVPLARPITPPHRTNAGSQADELALATSTAGTAWLDVLAFVLFMILLEFVAGAAIAIIVDIPVESLVRDSDLAPAGAVSALNRALLIPTIAIRALGSLGIIALILVYRGQSAGSVGLSRRRLAMNCLIGVAATVVAYGVIILSMSMLWLVWPGLLDQMQENAERIMDIVPRLDPLGFFGVAAVVGVYEEVVFRGFLMVRLRRASGSWIVAVFVSTAIFTALHALDQTHAALVSVTILSLVFSVVTIWRRSIVPAIVAHALFDFAMFIYLYVSVGDSWA